MKLLSIKLKELCPREHVYFTGNGTCAISLTLKALGIHGGRIAIPNNICINVPIAVLSSGNFPVYVDIDKTTLGLSPVDLENYIADVDVVIAAHAYGSICHIEEIKNLCEKHNVFLVEDCAVALGAKIRGLPVGIWGDVAIFSFGSGKIVDIGHGGAILLDDKYLMNELVNHGRDLPFLNREHAIKISKLNSLHTLLYNDFYGSNINAVVEPFTKSVLEKQECYLYRFDNKFEEKLISELNRLDDNIRIRNQNVKILQIRFSDKTNGMVNCFTASPGSVYWRFCLFCLKNRDLLLRDLLCKKYKISSWHPSVDLFFEHRQGKETKTPVSDFVGDTILNLWINGEIGKKYLEQISDEILMFYN